MKKIIKTLLIIGGLCLLCGCKRLDIEVEQLNKNKIETNDVDINDQASKKIEENEEILVVSANNMPMMVISDGNLSLTLGMAVEDFYHYYGEEGIVSESTPTNLITNDIRNGQCYEWYFYDFKDLSVSITNFGGMGEYIVCEYVIWTPRFQISSGIKVGDTLEKLQTTYGDKLKQFDETQYICMEGSIQTTFHIEDEYINYISIMNLDLW